MDTTHQFQSHQIKKIVNTRIGEDGLTYYQVQWQQSWETEEIVSKFPNLVDQFWDFVNNVQYVKEKRNNFPPTSLELPCDNTTESDVDLSLPGFDISARVKQELEEYSDTTYSNVESCLSTNKVASLGATSTLNSHSVVDSDFSNTALCDTSMAAAFQDSTDYVTTNVPDSNNMYRTDTKISGNENSTINNITSPSKSLPINLEDAEQLNSEDYFQPIQVGINSGHKKTRYKCKLCDQIIRKKCEMDRHFARHSGLKKYECLVCGHRFTEKHTLKKHSNKFHDLLE